jgi:hypothetical protein
MKLSFAPRGLQLFIFAAMLLAQSAAFAAPTPTSDATPADDGQESTRSKTSIGGYGAPELKVTSLASSAGLLAGSQGGFIIGHHLVLGGGGYGLASEVTVTRDGAKKTVGFGYGGFRPAFILGEPDSVVHFGGGIVLGAAGASVGDSDSSLSWVVEPDVGVDFRAVRWLRIGVAGSYRFVGAADKANLSFAQLSGPAAGLAIKVGSF